MIRFFLISILLFVFLDARENPFFASKGEKDITYSSNKKVIKTPLKRATITLPSQARILKKVTIEYKNLDGSIQKQSIELDNSIDWHLPVFISQSYGKVTTKPRTPKTKVQKAQKQKYKKLAEIKYAKFYSSAKTLKIVTKDKILRNFLLTDPHRVVIDFKRVSKMKSYSKINKKSIFNKIRIGNIKTTIGLL